jgi:glycine/D-amino acid oxidase-like deaminating enzyme
MSDPEAVAVVGGGAVGVTAARDLASAGVDVTLYERGDIAAESTGRAAGICYDAFADRIDAEVADRAVARFRDLAAETGFTFEARPYVWLAREGDAKRADAIREQVPRMRAHDRDVELLDAGALADRFPALRSDDVAVAAVAHDAAVTDPGSYAAVVAERAAAAGATVRTDTEVAVDTGGVVETPEGTASFDAVLVAAGAHTRPLLADAGVQVPVKPYRVQALVTDPVPVAADLPTLYDATRSFYARPKAGGILVGDGTEEREFDPDDWERDADDAFVAEAFDRLDAALAGTVSSPGAAERAWAGLCTATPDRDPLVGAVAPGTYVAVGWHGHGFMRAPAMGETVAEQIRGGDGIDPFDPDRFDGDESFDVVEGMTVD